MKRSVKANKAVFLDRDGVINEILYHTEMGIIDTPFTVPQFRLLPRVAEAIRLINRGGLKAIVISNQPGIAKKHFTRQTLEATNQKMVRSLARRGARLDGIYYCLHHPQGRLKALRKVCGCRKPRPGLLRRAAREHGIVLKRSYMVGDGLTDIQTGQRAGCKTIFIGQWKAEICQLMEKKGLKPDAVAANLWDAARLILRWEKNHENIS